MEIRPNDLPRHLSRKIEPLYVVHGDEPLLALEAGDEIRAAARKAGCEERDVFVVDQGFKWDAFIAANANLALFGGRKLIDLRIPGGKPGVDGAKALESYAANLNRDNVTLIALPRVDRATQNSAWFIALARVGATIAVYPIDHEALPRWIAARLARQNQRASDDVLAYLAVRSEGNLLAAKQEIEKLALVLPEGPISLDAVENATVDVARYDLLQASEAWLAGDCVRTVRIVSALEAEGEPVPRLLWQVTEDLRAIAAAQAASRRGASMAATRGTGAWARRQTALDRAARRLKPADVGEMIAAAAHIDALAKGLFEGNAWEKVMSLALALCGTPSQPLAESLRVNLR